jgi:hypothetical protein
MYTVGFIITLITWAVLMLIRLWCLAGLAETAAASGKILRWRAETQTFHIFEIFIIQYYVQYWLGFS